MEDLRDCNGLGRDSCHPNVFVTRPCSFSADGSISRARL